MKYCLIIMVLFLFSCGNDYTYTLHSVDGKQTITIINTGSTSYIIDGSHKTVPENNYVKVDLSSTPMRNYGDIAGCWKTDEYEWKILFEGVTVLENKLDSKRFKFGTEFPVDKDGIPTMIDFYNKPGCFEFGFEYNKLTHSRGEIKIK